jgi:hypothetical protein
MRHWAEEELVTELGHTNELLTGSSCAPTTVIRLAIAVELI